MEAQTNDYKETTVRAPPESFQETIAKKCEKGVPKPGTVWADFTMDCTCFIKNIEYLNVDDGFVPIVVFNKVGAKPPLVGGPFWRQLVSKFLETHY